MSPYRSADLRHDCGAKGCYMQTWPDWEWMRGCFPRGIMPGDIDGSVEVNRHLLLLEHKRLGANLQRPQIALFRAASARPDTTVLCLRHEPDDLNVVQSLVYRGGEPLGNGFQPTTERVVRSWLTDWSTLADSTRGVA